MKTVKVADDLLKPGRVPVKVLTAGAGARTALPSFFFHGTSSVKVREHKSNNNLTLDLSVVGAVIESVGGRAFALQ